jgi:hypothetical protein
MEMLTKLTYEGGTIGFYCSHSYAHTLKNTESLMPYALKGVDATLFSVFHALGMNVLVRPILGNDAWEEYSENTYEGGDESDEEWIEKVEERRGVTRAGKEFTSIIVTDERIEEGDDPSKVILSVSILLEIHKMIRIACESGVSFPGIP